MHAIVQMRPSFSYLDRADQKIKTDVGPAGDGGQLLFSKFLEMLIYGGSVFMDFVCTLTPKFTSSTNYEHKLNSLFINTVKLFHEITSP